MAKIVLGKLGTSLGLGVADLGTEYLDASQGYSQSLMNITDAVRSVAFVGGFLGTAYLKGKGAKYVPYAEAAMLASGPLFVKTLKRAADSYVLPKTHGLLRTASQSGFRVKQRGNLPINSQTSPTPSARTTYV
jgi:hypothetical protein